MPRKPRRRRLASSPARPTMFKGEALAVPGYKPLDDVAASLGVGLTTLRKFCREELAPAGRAKKVGRAWWINGEWLRQELRRKRATA